MVNAIIRLTRASDKTVYYSAGHGETELLEGTTNTGGLFLREAILGEGLKVKRLVLADEKKVPDDASALLIMAPRRTLLPVEREAIMKYLAKGGAAIFCNEPNTTTDIAEIVRPLGIEVGKDIIIEKSNQMLSGESYDAQSVISSYPQHPISANFHQATIFPTSSSVRRANKPAAGASVTELAMTSKDSWAESKPELVFSETPQAKLEEDDIKGPVSLAVAFEGGIAIKQGDNPVQDAPAVSKKSRIVVFGDADFVNNVNIRQLYNRDFFLNALNWVLGEEDSVSIRAGTMRQSTKTLADRQLRMIFLTTGILVPEVLAILGFVIWWRRSE